MSRNNKPQRGRRSAARAPLAQDDRDLRLAQRMHHERISELSLMFGLLAGVLTLATALPLFAGADTSWTVPVFGGCAIFLGLMIVFYLRAMSKINAIDVIEFEEHQKWAANIKESMTEDEEESLPRLEALQKLSEAVS